MSKTQTEEVAVTLLESASLAVLPPGLTDVGASDPVTVQRGMAVQTSEGQAAGHVAAVVLDGGQQEVTHVLLVQERRQLEYRLVPVALIRQVDEGQVLLRIMQSGIEGLPAWHGAQ
jgi:hypothetical protein